MERRQIGVLGAGMVGAAMALDLAKDNHVISFDRDLNRLEEIAKRNKEISTRQVDLTDYDSYAAWFGELDLLVIAVPGFMGYKVLEAAIACGKPIADISFFPEDARGLDQKAREKGITVVTDMGVAPGMGNLILGREDADMEVKAFECYVGGLPKLRRKPFEYKAPFSPIDVLEEYTRPARMKENGRVVVRKALSEIELMEFDRIGTLEAFNTDGLRSLLYSMPHIPDLKEKTLRYPGHASLILSLQQAGFFSNESLAGSGLTPLQATAAILLKDWKLGEEEEEFTIMQVRVKGIRDNKEITVQYDLYDEYDHATQTSSMARTTGYTCTAAASLLIRKQLTVPGIIAPEQIGSDAACFSFIMQHLKDRAVNWRRKETDGI